MRWPRKLALSEPTVARHLSNIFTKLGVSSRTAEALCAALDPRAGHRVLDVACGSGTAALVVARRYCEVAGIDYVPALIDRARQRALAEGLEVDFRVADAQELPFADESFDAVVSVYGVQFAPDQEQAARELLRVCRPGGRIGLASPMPEGWSGDFFATHGRYAPPDDRDALIADLTRRWRAPP